MPQMLALVPSIAPEDTRTIPAGYLTGITVTLTGRPSTEIFAQCLMEGFSCEAALALTGALAVLEASAP